MKFLPQRAESLLEREVEEVLEHGPRIRWVEKLFEGVAQAAQIPKEYLLGSSLPSAVLQQKLHQALLDREARVLVESLPEQDRGGEVVGLVKQGEAAFVARPEQDRARLLELVESFGTFHVPSVPLLPSDAYSKDGEEERNKEDEDELVALVEDRLLNGPPKSDLRKLFEVLDAAPLKSQVPIMSQQELDDLMTWCKNDAEEKK